MPLYIFQNPETQEVVEVFQKMNDKHVYFDEKGLKWKRIFTVPHASIATKIDPFNQSQFVRAGENKNETVGDMWDKSKEMSEKRAEQNGGVDPIRQKALEKYSKERGGMKHFSEMPKTFKNDQVTVEY